MYRQRFKANRLETAEMTSTDFCAKAQKKLPKHRVEALNRYVAIRDIQRFSFLARKATTATTTTTTTTHINTTITINKI